MAKIMTLPKIGVNMTEAVLSTWLVKEGDCISVGDAILSAETDKATQEIYATESGIVAKLLIREGDNVQINDPILILVDKGETLEEVYFNEDVQDPKLAEQKPNTSAVIVHAQPIFQEKKSIDRKVKISPLAKKLAREMNIDIRELAPSENGMRIVKNDILNFALNKSSEKVQVTNEVLEVIPLRGIRGIIADRMSNSNLEKPSAALTINVDASGMITLRDKFKAINKHIGFTDIIVKACARAMEDHRILNSRLLKESIEVLSEINIGVAMDTDKGLVVPVIKQTNRKTLSEISDELKNKAEAARDNHLSQDDLSGGTFTVSNLGMLGIINFTAVINPPECAILAVGSIQRTFVPDKNDNPIVRSNMKMTLSFDHRIVDGAPAARFLNDVKRYLENPVTML